MNSTLRRATEPALPSHIRLPRRRLYQGCALVLLFPTAAAFLPVQGRAPGQTIALVPVTTAPAASSSHSAPALLKVAAQTPAHKLSRLVRLSGLASWYGSVLSGHRTASGERFDPTALTACHPTLPFGTLVRVVNLINHRSVVVRITDRGILSANRVIDLSSAAAEQLDMLRAGVAPVRLEVQKMLKSDEPETKAEEGEPAGSS